MQQYWAGNLDAYEFIGVSQLAEAFQASGIGFETMGEEDLESGQRQKHRQPDQQYQGQEERKNKVQSNQQDQEQNLKKKQKGQQDQDSGLDPLVHDRWAV